MAAKAGVKLILLDDGMQHRWLARDFEVVVMDAFDPFGQGYFLPRGLYAEGLKSLVRADLIILNHVYDHDYFMNDPPGNRAAIRPHRLWVLKHKLRKF